MDYSQTPIYTEINTHEIMKQTIIDNVLNNRKLTEINTLLQVNPIENILTKHINNFINTEPFLYVFLSFIYRAFNVYNTDNMLFILKGGNVFRYYSQYKYKQYWNKINIDIKETLISNISIKSTNDSEINTELNNEINNILNMFSDFDFSLYIKEIDDIQYKNLIGDIYFKLLELRVFFQQYIIDKVNMQSYVINVINKDPELINEHVSQINLATRATDEMITLKDNNINIYTRIIPKLTALFLTYNNTIQTTYSKFDLFRIKIGFEQNRRILKAELFDLTIYKNNNYNTRNYKQIRYRTYVGENYKDIMINIPSTENMIRDLFLILFVNSTIAWNNNKYEKRLIRLAILLTINLSEDLNEENNIYFILLMSLLNLCHEIIDNKQIFTPRIIEEKIQNIFVSTLDKVRYTKFMDEFSDGQESFKNIQPNNDPYLNYYYNNPTTSVYNFMSKIILLYIYKFHLETSEKYNIWITQDKLVTQDKYTEDKLKYEKFIKIFNRTLKIGLINFVDESIKEQLINIKTKSTEIDTYDLLVGGNNDTITKLLKNMISFENKYYDIIELYKINGKPVKSCQLKDKYLHKMDDIIHKQNKLIE